MRKLISIMMVALMLLVSSNIAIAADDTIDIEKVAIQSIKNSKDVQNINRQVTVTRKSYADVIGMMNSIRGSLRYSNSYQTVEALILRPLETKNILNQVTNTQSVVTNAVQLLSYKTYIALLKANYALDIQKGLMNGLEADYKNSQLQQTLGMISLNQLRLSEIAFLKAQYRHNSAQNSLDSATLSVNNLMGEDIWNKYKYTTLQDYNITPVAQIKNLSEYVNLALANRAEIINAQGTLETKKKQYELGKAEIPNDFKFYIQQQEYAIENAQNDLELAKINVQLDITNLYKLLGSAMNNLAAKKNLEDQAVLNYQAAELKYQNSLISLLEFDDAKVAKAQADMDYKNAELDAWLIQKMMDSACEIGYVPSMK